MDVEGTAKQGESWILVWMDCVAENSMWKELHSKWRVVLWLECCVTLNIMWKVLHSRWIVVFCFECSVLQWTIRGRYYTASGEYYFDLNGMDYCEQYVEVNSQQVDSSIVGWMECVTVNIMWKVLHSRWSVVLWLECSVLQLTICGIYCT